jgi:uncharacterized membrane protein
MANRSLKEERELLLEVNKLRLQLDKPLFTEKGLGTGKKDLENLTAEIRILRAEANDLGDSFDGIYKSLADSVQEFTKMDSTVGSAKKNFKSIKDITEKLLQDAAGNSELSLKDLKSLDAKYKSSKKMLKLSEDVLLNEQDRNDSASEILGFLKEENAIRKSLEKGLEERIKREEAIEKSVGRTGAVLKGLSKIPVIGGLVNSEKILKDLTAEAKRLKGEMVSVSGIAKAFSKEAFASTKDPAVAFGVAAKLSKGLFNDIKNIVSLLDEYNGRFTKTFAISQEKATEMNKNFRSAAKATGNMFVTTKGMGDSFIELNKESGTMAHFSDKTLTTFTRLTKEARLSADAVANLQDLTYLSTKDLGEITAEYTGQLTLLKAKTGFALDERQLQEALKNVSAAVKIQHQGSATALAEAVFKAKALGLELKDLEGISSSLLNFQSSIEDELEAELLTGRQLNLEGARYAALIGDQAALAEELATNVGTAAEFGEMNVLAQDALAKSLGMNRNQLAETLMQAEKLNKLNAEGNTLQERYNTLKAQGNSEQQIAKMLGDETLAQQLESAGVQERFNLLIEGVKESFLPLAETILPKILNVIELVGNNLGLIIPVMMAWKGLQFAIAIQAAATAFAISPLTAIGIVAGTALVAGALTSIKPPATAIGDGQFSPDGYEITKNVGGLATKRWSTHKQDAIQVMPPEATVQAGQNRSNTSIVHTNIKVHLDNQVISNAKAVEAHGVGETPNGFGKGMDYSASSLA